jgi:PAS domain S-box-containing protein
MNGFDGLQEEESSDLKSIQKELAILKLKLSEQESLFNSITENTLAGYWIWDIPLNTMFISAHLKSMLGYADHELENSPETINMLMHPSDLPATYALLSKHVESDGKVPFEIEVRYKHKNGSIVWVICSGNIVTRDENGKPSKMIGCHLDNTELKKAQGVQKYTEELERKNVEMEQFAYVASHDLQEPLNTIQGFIALLSAKLEDAPDPDVTQYLHYINQSTLRMTNLIKGLLEYSRIGKNVVMSKIDCNQVITDVLMDLHIQVEETQADIEVTPLPFVMGYDIELRILFQNLISNALKFSVKRPVIKIYSVVEGDYFKFSVADNGIGIDPQFRDKIFKLYQQLHPKSTYEGNGLGLAQCFKIVTELHSGSIWVESNEKEGSIFHFTIPYNA